MSNMNIQLFVTDLDGTLLPTGRDVPAKNIEAVKRAVAAGVTVTIATGRMYRAALPVAQALGVDVPIITYNGALIKSVSGEVYDENYVPADVVCDVVDFCREHAWHVQTYSDDELYFVEHDEKAKNYEAAQVLKGHVVGWDGLKAHTEKLQSSSSSRIQQKKQPSASGSCRRPSAAACRPSVRIPSTPKSSCPASRKHPASRSSRKSSASPSSMSWPSATRTTTCRCSKRPATASRWAMRSPK